MPYISDTPVTVDHIPYPWCENKVMKALVVQAISEGRRVQVQCSAFSDPGKDWNELVIDGRPIPGSRIVGY